MNDANPCSGLYDIGPDGGMGGLFISEPQLLSTVASAETVYPHSMGRPPDYLAIRFTCLATNNNWSPGESWILVQQNAVAQGVVLAGTPGKVIAAWQGSNGGNVTCPDRSAGGGGGGIIATASWRFEVIAAWYPRI